jgi:hypothetical protein
MPDEALTVLAIEGRLRDPQVIVAQVDRMLQGRHREQFVKDFAAQWLDLVDIDFTEPDRKLHREFDVVVQYAMLDETHRFLDELLWSDASAARLVGADFSFLNSRLARFYRVDGVHGDQLQHVKLAADSHRGGLLTQGSILKVTANGTHTSPVLRGIWVSERILGVPIPPPAGVPAVEPDIRGARTIPEQLETHRADPSCAVCHNKIDPPDYALENFDAAGQWRQHYPRVDQGRNQSGAKIDASFALADGRTFADVDEFRRLVASDPRPLAANFAEKLLTYGTGAPITFVDRGVIEAILNQTADGQHGLRSLLDAVVTSPTFLSK